MKRPNWTPPIGVWQYPITWDENGTGKVRDLPAGLDVFTAGGDWGNWQIFWTYSVDGDHAEICATHKTPEGAAKHFNRALSKLVGITQ